MITVYNGSWTLPRVRAIPLAIPEHAGSRWKGIQHGELVDPILFEVNKRGWDVPDMKFAVGGDGSQLAAAFDIKMPKLDSPEGTSFALGLITDNSRHRALRLYAGATIAVCNNGLATGEIILQRRHTTGFNLRENLTHAMDDYLAASRNTANVIEGLRNRKLRNDQYEHLLIEAGRQDMMPWSRLADVDKEYTTPRFGDAFGSENSWSLLNAFTWVAKRNPPMKQMDQINRFRDLLPTLGV